MGVLAGLGPSAACLPVSIHRRRQRAALAVYQTLPWQSRLRPSDAGERLHSTGTTCCGTCLPANDCLNGPPVRKLLQRWARAELGEAARDPLAQLPSVYVVSEQIPQRQFPRLYKSAHCFVLPTRWVGGGGGGGSGWMFRPAVVPMQSPGALPCLADEPRRPVPGTGLQGRGLGAARGGGDVDGAARDCGEWGPSADEQTSAEQVDRWRPSSAVVWRMRAHDLPRSG